MATDMMDVPAQEKGRFRVELPDVQNPEALQGILGELQHHMGTYGVKTLATAIQKWQRTHRILTDQWHQIETSVRSVNGEPKPRVKVEESLDAIARKYFSGLSAKALRLQCGLFGLNYDAYASIDDMIEALVERQRDLDN